MLTDSVATSTPGQEIGVSPTRRSADIAVAPAERKHSASALEFPSATVSTQPAHESVVQFGRDSGQGSSATNAADALAAALQSAAEVVAETPPPPAHYRPGTAVAGSSGALTPAAVHEEDESAAAAEVATAHADPQAQAQDTVDAGGGAIRRGGLFGLLGRRRGGAASAASPDSPAREDVPADAVDAAVLDAARALVSRGGASAAHANADTAEIARELVRLDALRAQTERAGAEHAREAHDLHAELEAAKRNCANERAAAVAARDEATQAGEHMAALHGLFIRALQDVVLLQLRCDAARCAEP